MGDHLFGLGEGRIPDAVQDRAERIAKRHDASLMIYDDPASGWRYWFGCWNRGAPFDQATADAVLADLEAAGLAHDGKPTLGLDRNGEARR